MVFRFTRSDRIVRAEDINEYITLAASNAKIDTAGGIPTADYTEQLKMRPCLERDLATYMYTSEILLSQIE